MTERSFVDDPGSSRELTLIANMYESSDFATRLRGYPRWDRYRPEHVGPAEWRHILGADADSLGSSRLTYGLMKAMLRRDDGSFKLDDTGDATLLMVAALTHDWGKSIDTANGQGGDIDYNLRSTGDMERERSMFGRVFESLLGETHVKQRYIVENIVFNPESRLGAVFDAVERLSYLRTACLAFRASESTDDEVLAAHLRWLAAGTISNQLIKLMTYAEIYTPVREVLSEGEQEVSRLLHSITQSDFEQFEPLTNARWDLVTLTKSVWSRSQFTGNSPGIETSPDKGIFDDTTNFESRYIGDYDELRKVTDACKTLGLKVVLTSGSFDLLHIGHARYIDKAKSYGDVLVVGVDSDAKIQERKGPSRPIVEEAERLRMLAHLRSVDLLTLKHPHDVQWQLIRTIKPDVLIATAETYTAEEIAELERDHCGQVIVLEPQATTSTSARIRKLNITWAESITKPLSDALEGDLTVEELRAVLQGVIEKLQKS